MRWWLATASSERIYLAVREITLINLPCKMGKNYENDAKCSPVARLRDGVDLGGYRQDRGWQVERPADHCQLVDSHTTVNFQLTSPLNP
jgi:hypothetical protein